MKKRIVAEVTRNWNGSEVDAVKAPLLSQRFEKVIAVNAERGFELESWQFHSCCPPGMVCMCETIVAVFVENIVCQSPDEKSVH